MDTLLQDLRYAIRRLFKSPGFTLVAVLTLALGIGATTALFSAIDALLLRPLPVHEPGRLVEIRPVMGNATFERDAFSHPEFRAMQEGGGPFSGIAATDYATLDFGVGDRTEEIQGRFVTGNYFSLLGVRPALGRFFGPAADRPGSGGAGVVLSHALWERWFGGDSAAIGTMVRLNGRSYPVVAVMEAAFTGTSITSAPRLWLPFGIQAAVERTGSELNNPMDFPLSLIGRLRPGITPARAEAQASALARQTAPEGTYELIRATSVTLHPLERVPLRMHASVLRMATLLGVASLLVLLIAGINVAGMLLVRGSVRQHEIAIREAIGAGRARIVRQLLTEGLVLWLLGGAAGVLLAAWLIDLLLAFRWPSAVPLEVALNGRVLGFALLVSLVTGVGFGLLPALSASRPALVPMLKDGRARRRGPIRLQSALVVG
ncbi:MAG TPA: ABC transporter permease, partial [Longimicrobiaceae bacterium]|nr:ABC transporter permease [Longimicrobiaceae bacterium]